MSIEALSGTEPAALVVNATIPEPPVDDFRADVIAAMKQVEAKAPAETITESVVEPALEAAPTRQRDPATGQFMKADGTVDPDQTPTPVTDADQHQDTAPEPSTAPVPPKGWSADAKAKWSALDPSIQAEIDRRERDIDNGGRQWSEQKRGYEETLAPLNNYASRYSIDSKEALNRLLGWQQALETNSEDAIVQLAQIAGVDLAALINPSSNRPQVQPDPHIAALVNTVSQLQQTVMSREERETLGIIEGFKAKPGHEHFDTVRTAMGRMMELDPSLTIDTAYDQAVWANPDTRKLMLDAQSAASQQQTRTAAQVGKAKAAAVSPRGSGATAAPMKPKGDFDTVRDAALAAAREHGWAV